MKNIYELVGGEKGLRSLVDLFYQIMDTDEKAKTIRALHPKNLKVSRDKLFMFLSGLLGGPDLYVEKYGHPRLRKRHMPFPIGPGEVEEWLYCMFLALDEMGYDEQTRAFLDDYFTRTAKLMQNRGDVNLAINLTE
jgi:hemoglobin